MEKGRDGTVLGAEWKLFCFSRAKRSGVKEQKTASGNYMLGPHFREKGTQKDSVAQS